MKSLPRGPARPVDERERQIRDRAEALAFRLLAGSLALACLYSGIRDGWDATLRAEDVLTLVALAMIANVVYLARKRATVIDGDGPPTHRRRAVAAAAILALAMFGPPLIVGVSAADLLPIAPVFAAVLAVLVVSLAWLERRRRHSGEPE
jgi:hypothetical protein